MSPILTPAQSIEARENLSLQQPVVVSGVKSQHPDITFTKTYLSEFESGSRNLPPKTLRCLRDFYEAQGHVFEDAPEVADAPQPGEAVRVVRDALVVCDRMTHAQRGEIQDRIRELMSQLQIDMRKQVKITGFAPSARRLDEETEIVRNNAINMLAEIGLLYASLFGNCLFNAPSKEILDDVRKLRTISDVLSIRFVDALKLVVHPDLEVSEEAAE